MLTLVYEPKTGKPVNDSDTEDFVLSRKDKDIQVIVGTENVIHKARALVKRMGLRVQFIYEGKLLTPNKDGRLASWPKGFCDHMDDCLDELL